MRLDVFQYPGWIISTRPGPGTRPWMEAAPEGFASRCLPLVRANQHGWEILAPSGFEVRWDGGDGADGVKVRHDEPRPGAEPVSLFGLGTITWHLQGLFKTEPGWDLFVTGPVNSPRHGIHHLSGVVETDWSPYSFTLNAKLTKPNRSVRFEAGDPIAMVFPVRRGALDQFRPRLRPIEDSPELRAQYEAWSRSRDAFQAAAKRGEQKRPADRWSKDYWLAKDADGKVRGPSPRKRPLAPFAPIDRRG